MKKMWAVYIVVAAVLYLIGNTLYVAGSFKSIQQHRDGTISTIYTEVPGPEDFDLDPDAGLLFISSTDRWKVLNGKESMDGIFILNIDSGRHPRKLATTYDGEFHPHGISFLRADSLAFLFVINHNHLGDFVECFEFKQDTLFHIRSFADKSMCCPNDVVAVGRDKFYVTNDHGSSKGLARTLEEYLQLPSSYLLYYDGHDFAKAYTGIRYGNGVNISNDGTKLYLATTTGRTLLTFERDLTSGQLVLKSKLPLHTGLDNISVDDEGNLWIAAHPKLLAFVGHAKDSTKRSPSQLLKLVPGEAYDYRVEEVFMDDGAMLSGSSIALRYKNELFVGGVFQRRILRFQLKKPQ